ncbi:MAG: TonB-dependent receptor plug domain-containing protein [Gemmatimonadetes bacterium]|nr:TonB-dependent receptor plug domain-containing protein [Gemmatimonadota bacterium]
MRSGSRTRSRRPPTPLTLPACALALGFVLAVMPCPASAQSQASTGVIRGQVLDATGTPVAGAVVEIVHLETALATTVRTTSAGTFVRPLLPLGRYDVAARAEDQLGSAVSPGLVLRVGEELSVTLRFGVVELEGITVEGHREQLVHPEDVTSSTRLPGEVVDALPNNGRNYLDLALLTPGVAISQGPDGDELNISGQRGIFNNFIVDGADFNNPFFGEQRGGQRPAFTFSQDAIEEVVVVNQGAAAEFGRSAGGFVNVITKSGSNEFAGSAHYFGQWDGVSAAYPAALQAGEPDFLRSQFGFTVGGPIVRDRAFYFVAYDQQAATETKQARRLVREPGNLARLRDFLTARWPGLFDDEFGPITRTDDARALLFKTDFHLDGSNQLSFKYNYNWSEQLNGTFDVDSWGVSANGVETDEAHAFNFSWRSLIGSTMSHELRVQWAREDRVRWYDGPLMPGSAPPATPQFAKLGGRPFPDIGMDFADGFRIGLPFFLPIDPAYDTRLQVVDNWSWLTGRHLLKAGVEYNRTGITQQFIGFANGRYIFDSVDGFINFVTQGSRYVTCSDGSDSATGECPAGTAITGPVLTYLQSGTVPGVAPDRLGRGDFGVDELALFLQDTWKPNDRLTVNLGLRWEGTWHPQVAVQPEATFFAPYLNNTRFPSDGTVPDDLDNFQPRLGLAWDVGGDRRTVVRLNAGAYHARIPILVFAQSVTTNGAFQQIFFRSSFGLPEQGPPAIGELIDGSATAPFLPDIHVTARDLELPRTWSFAAEIERELPGEVAASLSYQHARGDHLFRFVNRNDAVFGSPFGIGTHPGGGGIGTLTVAESTARSRYHAVTAGLRAQDALDGRLALDLSYTLSFDKSDDDNERDPFTFRYADASNLAPDFGWSDRDRRHKATGYLAFSLPGDIAFSHILRYLSASPVSESCARRGERAAQPSDRICTDGGILERNTLRRENAFFTWDIKLSRPFAVGGERTVEPVFEIFNLTNADNSLDTARGSLLFNFDGSIRSGLGDTRRAQLGARLRF